MCSGKHPEPACCACRQGRLQWRLSQGGLLLALCLLPLLLQAAPLSGDQIMQTVQQRHDIHPFVFERQAFVLTDRNGDRGLRLGRRYSRMEADGTLKWLLTFDQPTEVAGVALLAVRKPSGDVDGGVYFPALGAQLKRSSTSKQCGHFLDTDFTLMDLAPEALESYRYERLDDVTFEEIPYYVVNAWPATEQIKRATGYGLRRHYINQSSFYIERTDYFDRHQQLFKRLSRHDLKRVKGDAYRADMILMENFRDKHQSLIKIRERAYSPNYVPPELFETDFLFRNGHRVEPGSSLSPLDADNNESR